MNAFKDTGIITSENKISGWVDSQSSTTKKDATAKDRMRRYRERLKQKNVTENSVTNDVTTVTLRRNGYESHVTSDVTCDVTLRTYKNLDKLDIKENINKINFIDKKEKLENQDFENMSPEEGLNCDKSPHLESKNCTDIQNLDILTTEGGFALTPSDVPKNENKAYRKPRAKKLSHVLPKDFALTDDMINYAFAKSDQEGLQWDIRYIQNKYEEFCNYYWAKGEERADWDASYRNWILKDVRYCLDKKAKVKPFVAPDIAKVPYQPKKTAQQQGFDAIEMIKRQYAESRGLDFDTWSTNK